MNWWCEMEKLEKKLAEAVNGQISVTDRELYIKQADLIYRIVVMSPAYNAEVQQEIIEIEKQRVHIERVVPIANQIDLFDAYNRIAFLVAQNHYFQKKDYKVASILREVFMDFIRNPILFSDDNREVLKNSISEIVLDFDFAAGGEVASLRMGKIIENLK